MNQPQQKNRTDWQNLVEQQANSGQSVSGFCRDQQVSTSGFYVRGSDYYHEPTAAPAKTNWVS